MNNAKIEPSRASGRAREHERRVGVYERVLIWTRCEVDGLRETSRDIDLCRIFNIANSVDVPAVGDVDGAIE
jgi:hypothetical protein